MKIQFLGFYFFLSLLLILLFWDPISKEVSVVLLLLLIDIYVWKRTGLLSRLGNNQNFVCSLCLELFSSSLLISLPESGFGSQTVDKQLLRKQLFSPGTVDLRMVSF